MAIKIITLDLDGTLMLPDHITVSERNRTALKKAHDKGVKIAISTGRTLAIMGDVCEQVPQVDYVMYSNGAAVLDRNTNKNIYTNLMSNALCNKILDYLDEFPVFYEVYIDGASYCCKDREKYFDLSFLPKKFLDELTSQITPCEDIRKVMAGKEIEKITIYCIPKNNFETMWNHFDSMNEIALTSSLRDNMEMTAATADKGTALKGMCDALGITAEESMAFGDAGNDCPMLRFSEYSFAMENGTDECKNAAKYITSSNADDGVAVAVEKYIID